MKRLPTILEKFYDGVRSHPEACFLSEPVQGLARSFTWGAADQQVRRMAQVLRSMNLPPQSKVAILGKNSAHWILADLAIMMAGHVSVPLYPNVLPNTLRTILDHSESRVIFIGKLDGYDALQREIPRAITRICFSFHPQSGCLDWDELIHATPPVAEDVLPDPQTVNCILYTSGTTGEPKGVMHTHHAHSFSMMTVYEALNNDLHREVFFSYLPLCHVAERMVIEYAGVFSGGTIYFPGSMESFPSDLQRAQPTVFLAVPRIWEKFRDEILKKLPQPVLDRLLYIPGVSYLLRKLLRKKLGLSRAKYVLTGAAPIHLSLLQWFARLGIHIQEGYGMTENMALSTINRRDRIRFGTVGQTFPGVAIRLGSDGEILIRSESSMLGYYKEPDLTAQSFEEGFLRTGDEGQMDAEGYLRITGRIKDQFKTSKGKYIAPGPIEKLLMESPHVAQACVVGSGCSHPLALCVLREGIVRREDPALRNSLETLLTRVNEKLESHERLARLVVVAEEWGIANGFYTPTLKIRRKQLDLFYGDRYITWLSAGEPVILV
ncbi:MAG: hypothetical protein RJA57_1468 [Bacteroidota bacterium]